jgi:MFS family permease
MAVLTASTDDASLPTTTPLSAWLSLALLFVVYALNYLDRTLIYILFAPIKAELLLSDLQLALLGSTSFVLFYTILGVPFGRLADRVSRRRMIAAGLATWSLASAATGWMTTFEGLFLCRVLVGVGEATLAPAALSLLADLFPARLRATAGALYSAGIPLGAGLALWLGGGIGESMGWRPAFLLLGLPGVALAALVLWLPEPTRAARPAVTQRNTQSGIWSVITRPAWALQVAGYAVFAIATNALPMWVPGLLRARFDLGLAEVGAWMGACAVLGGLAGSALGGVLADLWQQRTPAGRAWFGAVAAGLAAVAWVLVLSGPTFGVAIAAVGVLMALGLAWLGPAAADVQDLAGVEHRGLAIGVYLFAVNALGHGFGPPLFGWLNDRVGAGVDPTLLAKSLVLSPLVSVVGAALLAGAGVARVRAARVATES